MDEKQDTIIELLRENAEQEKEIETLRYQLYNILALLNRDGGHYREKHGTVAAIENGLRMHYEYAQQADKCDEWKRRAEILYRCAQWPSVEIPKDAVKWFEEE